MKLITPNPAGMPDVIFTTKGGLATKQLATEMNINWLLNELAIKIRYNAQTEEIVYTSDTLNIPPDARAQGETAILIEDMALRLNINNLDRVYTLGNLIAKRDPFHPMADWIESEEWDGVDRFSALIKSVPSDTILWPVYLKKWFYQVIEGVFGDAGDFVSIPHVLVFTGEQGTGKTSWVRSLAPDSFVLTEAELHLNGMNAKDNMLQVLQYPIVELGEIDSSFKKSDVASLKVFLSRTFDEIRAPYARCAIKRKRRTTFSGTVNHSEFLVDGSGSRRFWPVNVTGRIDINHNINMQQLWAQALVEYDALLATADGEPWSLSRAEESQRVLQSEDHVLESTSIQAVRSSFNISGSFSKDGNDLTTYCLANAAEIMEMAGVQADNMFAVSEVKSWLVKTLGKHRKLKQKQQCWCVPKMTQTRGTVRAIPVGIIGITKEDAKAYLADTKKLGKGYDFGSQNKKTDTHNNVTDLHPKN